VTQTTETRIYGGAPDLEAQSGVVALRIGLEAPYEICSGALIAPNVVLTARHCVSRMVAKSVVCTDRGESANGAHVAEDQAASGIGLYLGEEPNFRGAPQAFASQLVHTGGTSLCNSDVAFVVLDRPIADATPLRVRLDGRVQPNEKIRAIGYGRSDNDEVLGRRLRRDDIGVLAVGARLTASSTALGDREFEVGRSICQGDSGGPSISVNTGAVVGVVSRGADCRQDFGHVYTQTSGFEHLFGRALEIADATMTLEDGRTLDATDLGVGGAPPAAQSDSGCSIASSAPSPARSGFGASSLLVGLAAVLLRMRRSREK
jgi:hypothetical protein